MAKRNPGRRRSSSAAAPRSRKRRPDPQQPRGDERATRTARADAAPAPLVRPSQRHVGLLTDTRPVGERPPPPWHPMPLSELLIFVGIVGTLVAFLRGPERNAALLGAGIGAVAIGTIEVSLREHLSGFRPHTGLLAAVPAVVFHSAVVLIVLGAQGGAPQWLYYGLLPVDGLLVTVCFKLLRARFVDARRARTGLTARPAQRR